MIGQPTMQELLDAVTSWLRETGDRSDYPRRVAINVLAMVSREMTLGPAASARSKRRLRALLGREGNHDELNRQLVIALRTGTIAPDDPAVVNHMRQGALDMLAIDQPSYAHGVTQGDDNIVARNPLIDIVEVSPRDGLQNEAVVLPTADKLALIARAMEAGARRIEVASFVHPKRVPQMADAEAVVAGLPRTASVEYVGLVLNTRGALRAIATDIDEIGMVCSASDTFGERNQGMPSDASIEAADDVLNIARAAGISAQVTIAVAFGCPFEGAVDPARVAAIAARLAGLGPREIAIADTIGVARPHEVSALIDRLRPAVGSIPLRAHFHDTRGTGVANVVAAIGAGVSIVDASIGGTGGCPFAPGASGNVATEDVVYALGTRTNLELDLLVDAARWLGERLGKRPASALAHAGDFRPSSLVGVGDE